MLGEEDERGVGWVWVRRKRRVRERRSLANIVTLNFIYLLTLVIEKNQRLVITQ